MDTLKENLYDYLKGQNTEMSAAQIRNMSLRRNVK